MNQITTQYITENGACYEQYVITDPAAKTSLTITPERGGMDHRLYPGRRGVIWTRRPNFGVQPPRFGVRCVPHWRQARRRRAHLQGQAYPMETHGFADLCAWKWRASARTA